MRNSCICNKKLFRRHFQEFWTRKLCSLHIKWVLGYVLVLSVFVIPTSIMHTFFLKINFVTQKTFTVFLPFDLIFKKPLLQAWKNSQKLEKNEKKDAKKNSIIFLAFCFITVWVVNDFSCNGMTKNKICRSCIFFMIQMRDGSSLTFYDLLFVSDSKKWPEITFVHSILSLIYKTVQHRIVSIWASLEVSVF